MEINSKSSYENLDEDADPMPLLLNSGNRSPSPMMMNASYQVPQVQPNQDLREFADGQGVFTQKNSYVSSKYNKV